MLTTVSTLKHIVIRLEESQDLLDEMLQKAIKQNETERIQRIHKRLQAIGTMHLDYKFRLSVLEKKYNG